MVRTAIIDLGTNTFNLLIAEIKSEGAFEILLREEHPVKLGDGGLLNNMIAEIPFRRGIDSLRKLKETALSLDATEIVAFATSAIRSALNGKDFVESARSEAGIEVKVIDGNEEASLIVNGVKLAGILNEFPSLVMDIGGGSTEFIISDFAKIYWKKSFNLGVSRLLQKFIPSDPIKPEELREILTFLDSELQPLFLELKKNNVSKLIGCSGSFESFALMIREGKPFLNNEVSSQIFLPDFFSLYSKLLKSTEGERRLIKGLTPMRIDSIVFACIFVKLIVEKFCLEEIIFSDYALKEGVLYEKINGDKSFMKC